MFSEVVECCGKGLSSVESILEGRPKPGEVDGKERKYVYGAGVGIELIVYEIMRDAMENQYTSKWRSRMVCCFACFQYNEMT